MTSTSALREYLAKVHQKLGVPLILVGVMAVFMTVAVVHQTSRISHLERRSLTQVTPKAYRPPYVYQSGAIYTHWGKRNCTSRRSIEVYSGVAAGQLYTYYGGGSNFLCLPMTPQWGNYTDTFEGTATIYGVEYEVSLNKNNIKSGMFVNNKYTLQDQNVPCAVCETRKPATVMMIAGRKDCLGAWQLEYTGYLMSPNYAHKGRSDFICVDKEPEADTAGYRNENGGLLYHVQAKVGSLPSPPYVDNRELTCVVCSK